ncbi:MAG: hypothetical protein J4F29_25225 [Candidatus Latescibacteria bacterium]|nr:hypothetical protein [Candidatus Latescibacterota bacterium]
MFFHVTSELYPNLETPNDPQLPACGDSQSQASQTAFGVIILFIIDELSYDHFHEKADRIYRIVSEFENESTGEMYQMATTPYQLTELLKEQFSEIEQTVRFYEILSNVVDGLERIRAN